MDPTTIRLPPDTLDELDSEYADYGYATRADYIRDIIEHRDPPFETTETTADYDRPTTDDYERLRDRVEELAEQVDELEQQLNQQSGRNAGGVLVKDETADIDLPAAPSSGSEPYPERVQTALAVLRQADQPLRRAEIMAVVDSVEEIVDETLWTEHVRPAIKDAGARLDGRKWVLDEK